MSGKIDIVKGRIKEAVGVLTNNKKLREAGKTDQEDGKVKQAAEKIVAEQTVDKAKQATDNTRE